MEALAWVLWSWVSAWLGARMSSDRWTGRLARGFRPDAGTGREPPWIRLVIGARVMVDDRRTDLTLEQIEQAAMRDGDVDWND